ncbi:MAG: ATP-binding cassette domain-containing protein [Candidatus Omnitrophica bacterium]|nr:ATP-binding cassette domain-containing protein [Candidatus Omnitrophota bacterium]
MIIQADNISKVYTLERGILGSKKITIQAIDKVSFIVKEFTTLGIVGESGSGKTTLAKIIARLLEPTSGCIKVNPVYIQDFRKDVQIIFQNPLSSLNPKMRVCDTLREPLLIHRLVKRNEEEEKVLELLKLVGLENNLFYRYPHQLSGGQRQRVCIARALAVEPKVLILDEPISSLDLTVQVKMLDLFVQLKEKLRLTYLFISHNLAVIKYVADSVIVMKEGRIVEEGNLKDIFEHPQETYTKNLIACAGCKELMK